MISIITVQQVGVEDIPTTMIQDEIQESTTTHLDTDNAAESSDSSPRPPPSAPPELYHVP